MAIGLYVTYWEVDGLRAPWTGTILVALALSLIAAGYLLTLPAAFLLVGVLVLVPVAIHGWEPEPTPAANEICDPSCGFGTLAFLFLTVPTALTFVAIGLALRIGRAWFRNRSARRGGPKTHTL